MSVVALQATDRIGGKYIVQYKLDEGGSAIVYVVEPIGVQGKFLVAKELAPAKLVYREPGTLDLRSADEEAFSLKKERFADEYRRMELVKNLRAFPEVETFIWDHNTGYIIQERILGTTLSALEPLHEVADRCARAELIMRDLARCVSVLHDHLDAHNDIAPGNAMWETVQRVRIIDLGSVRELGHTSVSAEGTLPYMAPERLLDGAPGSTSTDVYSLAAVANFLVTGVAPPVSTGMVPAEYEAAERRRLARLEEARPYAPRLIAAIEAGMSPAAQRPATVDAWCRVLDGEPVGPIEPTTGPTDDRSRYIIDEVLPPVGSVNRYRGRRRIGGAAVLLCQNNGLRTNEQVNVWARQGQAINRARRDADGGLAGHVETFDGPSATAVDREGARFAWTVFEWVEGPTLADRPPMSRDDAVQSLVKPARALDVLRSLGWQHGRVGANNLIVTGDQSVLVGHLAVVQQVGGDHDLHGLAGALYTILTGALPPVPDVPERDGGILGRVAESQVVGDLYRRAREGSYEPHRPDRAAAWLDEVLAAFRAASLPKTTKFDGQQSEDQTDDRADDHAGDHAGDRAGGTDADPDDITVPIIRTEPMPTPPAPPVPVHGIVIPPPAPAPAWSLADLRDFSNERSLALWRWTAIGGGALLGVLIPLWAIGTP